MSIAEVDVIRPIKPFNLVPVSKFNIILYDGVIQAEKTDLFTQLKALERQLEFLDIQVSWHELVIM